MNTKFYKDKSGKWRWQLLATNGRIVADSGQGYSRKWTARMAYLKFILRKGWK